MKCMFIPRADSGTTKFMAVNPIHRRDTLLQKFSKDSAGKIAISDSLNHSTLKYLIIAKKLYVLI